VTARLLTLTLVLLLAPVLGADAAPAAPGFKVRLLDSGTTVDSHDVVGKKILVLRFQASYCKPCAKESAALGRVYDRYRTRGVEVLAVHVQDTAADTRAFVRKYKPTYPIALDPKLTIGNSFGFKGTPYTVVIDQKGEMVTQLQGESVVGKLPRILDELLKKGPPPTPPPS
jgi:peroxiredoxin